MQEIDILDFFPALKIAGPTGLENNHLPGGDTHAIIGNHLPMVSLVPGKTAKAKVDFLGLKNHEAKLSSNMQDEGVATLEMGRRFDFSSLFPQIHFDNIDLPLLKDVKVHLKQLRNEGRHETAIILEGMLDTTKGPLTDLGKFLKIKKVHVSGEVDVTGDIVAAKDFKVDFIRICTSASFFVPISDGIVLKKANLQFTIHRQIDMVKMELGWDYGIMLCGTLELTHIGKNPVELDCCVSYSDSNLHVSAQTGHIENLFGINGLNLESFQLAFTIGTNSQIELEASFLAGFRTYEFGGLISGNGAGLYTSVENFDLYDLDDIYASITGQHLQLPDYEIKFKKVMLGIASANCDLGSVSLHEGLTVQCEATIHDHTCQCLINISTKGIYLSGSVSDIAFDGIEFKTSKLELYIYGSGSGKPSGFSISGNANIKGIELDYEVTLEKLKGQWQYLLYGALQARSTRLSDIFPSVKDSLADSIHFSSLVFIYSSTDTTTSHSEHSYTVRKGIQLMGVIDDLPALNKLTRKKNSDLIFSAYYGSTTKIGLEVPQMTINMGSAVTTEPLRISLELTPPAFELQFGLGIIPVGQLTPLKFYLLLKLGLLTAEGSVSMEGDWQNAFSVQGLTISDVALSVAIIYEQFFTTGTPSEFGFTGKIQMGEAGLKVGVKISEDPTKEILTGELTRLSAKDLIAFAKTITSLKMEDKNIPDFFYLEELKFYAAPNGGTIGVFVFEPGISFSARLVLFGKSASVYTRFSSAGIVAKGHIDHLELGPLKISGRRGPDAELELEISQQRQYFKIDGAFEFFGTGVGIYAEISKNGVEFDFQQKFLGLLDFTIYVKSTAFSGDPSKFDFILSAEFNDHIADYLKTTFTKNIDDLIHLTENSIDVAQRNLDQARIAYEASFKPAFKRLEDATAAAQKHFEKCKADLEKEERVFNENITNLRLQANRIRDEWTGKINVAINNVSEAQRRFDNNIREAEANVNKAKFDFDNKINQCSRELEAARKVYDRTFAEVDCKFRSAYNNVQSLEAELNDAQREFNNLKFPSSIYRGPYLTGKIAGLVLAIKAGSLLVNATQKLVNGFHKGSEAIAFDATQKALNLAQQGTEKTIWNGAIAILEKTRFVENTALTKVKDLLVTTRNQSKLAIDAAEKSVELAEIKGHQLITTARTKLLNIASSATYVSLDAAKKALQVIEIGTEKMAFDTAKANLLLAKELSTSVLKLGKLIAENGGNVIVIEHIKLTAQLSRIKNGELFTAEIRVVLLGTNKYTWNDITLDVRSIGNFIDAFFAKVVAQLKLLAAPHA